MPSTRRTWVPPRPPTPHNRTYVEGFGCLSIPASTIYVSPGCVNNVAAGVDSSWERQSLTSPSDAGPEMTPVNSQQTDHKMGDALRPDYGTPLSGFGSQGSSSWEPPMAGNNALQLPFDSFNGVDGLQFQRTPVYQKKDVLSGLPPLRSNSEDRSVDNGKQTFETLYQDRR